MAIDRMMIAAMPNPITRIAVRKAELRDAPAIARVHVDSWQAAYLGIIPAAVLNNLSVPAEIVNWRRILSLGPATGTRVWVVVHDAAILGFSSVGPSRDYGEDPRRVGEVYTIYLTPAAWGRGLGAELLDAALSDLVSRHCSIATIWVLEGNTRARRFYELSGFTRDGARRPTYVGRVSLPEIRYRREI